MLNRECFIVQDKAMKAQKVVEESGPVTMDQLANVSIRRADGLFEVDAGSFSDAATDLTESWLYEAVDIADGLSQYEKLDEAAALNSRRFSIQRGHYELWQHALWQDWRLTRDGQYLLFSPADRKLASLFDAYVIRQQSNFMEYAWIDRASWPNMSAQQRREVQLPLTIITLEQKPHKRRRFVVGRPSINVSDFPPYLLAHSGLEGSYVSPFLRRPLPNRPELTCQLILCAWYVLLDLADILAAKRPRATFRSQENVRQWALVVRRKELVDALRRTLNVAEVVAAILIEFLSWSKGCYKGLWGAPLVPLPGNTNNFAIAHNVLATSNVIRRVEIWLTKGGLDDNLARAARGSSYETQLRRQIGIALRSNEIVRNSVCANKAIKKNINFPEEIDLLIQFSSLMLVGEVKCLLTPTDSRERYNFIRNIEKYTTQATRKAVAVTQHLDTAAAALKISETEIKKLHVLPILVLNIGFGMSMVFGDCVVTDAKFLKLYLGSGKYISNAAFNTFTGKWVSTQDIFYRNAVEAAKKFEETTRRPPTLYRYIDRLRPTTFSFPTSSGEPLLIARTELTNPEDDERKRLEALSALVGR